VDVTVYWVAWIPAAKPMERWNVPGLFTWAGEPKDKAVNTSVARIVLGVITQR